MVERIKVKEEPPEGDQPPGAASHFMVEIDIGHTVLEPNYELHSQLKLEPIKEELSEIPSIKTEDDINSSGSKQNSVEPTQRCLQGEILCYKRDNNVALFEENSSSSIHTSGGPHKCNNCKKTFIWLDNFNTHILTCNRDSRNFFCTQNSTTNLNLAQIAYQCEVCEKYFSCSAKLLIHKRTHTGEYPNELDSMSYERPYKCFICDKSFKTISTLSVHKKIHSGVRPYKCDICEKSFNKKAHMTAHKLIHTGERPFKCIICEKTFRQATTLTTHYRVHRGDRSYKCYFCAKYFNSASHFNLHFKKCSNK